jgi:hypothetical protein
MTYIITRLIRIRLSAYAALRTVQRRGGIYLGVLYLVGVLFILLFLAGEIRKEVSFHEEYGEQDKLAAE